MYSRNRYSRYGGSWYQSVFWVLVGILIGQFIKFDLNLQPRESNLPSQSRTEIV